MLNASFYKTFFGFAAIVALSLTAIFAVGWYEVRQEQAALAQSAQLHAAASATPGV
jgi:hypothetical protein